ncbi:lactoylglutathione lyase [Spinellus fusiger]|nr:lactoylglutathione lyase [Spinellus fusiger]
MTTPSKYVFNHTMIRIKDPKASLWFYQEVLGMKLITKSDHEESEFSLYFLAHIDELPESEEERKKLALSIPGVLELTHNWGTEDNTDFAYDNEKGPRKGFGHIAILVDDIHKAFERFEELNVRFVKRLHEGKMKNIGFIADPDNYLIEIIQNASSNGVSPI